MRIQRQYKDFTIEHDGLQWILRRRYEGKNKAGEPIDAYTSCRYFPTVQQLAREIGEQSIIKMFNEETEKFLEYARVTELKDIPSEPEVTE